MADRYILEDTNDNSAIYEDYPQNILYWHIAPRTYVPARKDHEGNIVVQGETNKSLVDILERIVVKLISEQGWTFEEFKIWIHDIFHKCSNRAGGRREVNSFNQIPECDRLGIHKALSANPDSNKKLETHTNKSYLVGNGDNETKSPRSTTSKTLNNDDFFYVEDRRRKFTKDGKYIMERETRRLEIPKIDEWLTKVNSTTNIRYNPSDVRDVESPLGKSLIQKQKECQVMPKDFLTTRGKYISNLRDVDYGQDIGKKESHKSEEHEFPHDLTKYPAFLDKNSSFTRDSTGLYQTLAKDRFGKSSNGNSRTKMASDIDERGRKVFRFIKHYSLPSMNHNQDTNISLRNNENAKNLAFYDTFSNKNNIDNNNKTIPLINRIGEHFNAEDSVLQNEPWSVSRLLKSNKNLNTKPITLRLNESLKCRCETVPEPIMDPKSAPKTSDGNKVDVQRLGYQPLKTNPESFLRYLKQLYPAEIDKNKRLRKEEKQPSTNLQSNGINQYKKIVGQVTGENKYIVKLEDSKVKIPSDLQSLVRKLPDSSIEGLWHRHKIWKSRVKIFNDIEYLHHRRGRSFRTMRYLRNPSRLLLGGRLTQQLPTAPTIKERLPITVDNRFRFKRSGDSHKNIINQYHNTFPLHLASKITYNHPTQHFLLADKSVVDEVNPLPRPYLEIESRNEQFCIIM